MQGDITPELAAIWQSTPPWRKCVLQGERVILVPNPDGWGTRPVRLHKLDAAKYQSRLRAVGAQQPSHDRNRRLFAVWEGCAQALRKGLRQHKQPAKRKP